MWPSRFVGGQSLSRALEVKPSDLRTLQAAQSGYTLARVRFEIIFGPSAVAELRALPSHLRSEVRDEIETHLRFELRKLSRSRIKRLRGLDRPQFRLRVGETRVFYDVTENAVEVLAVVSKPEAEAWLEGQGTQGAPGGSGDNQG